MKQLASMRSNMRFIVDYDTAELQPVVELILLTQKPSYSLTKNNIIQPGKALQESRFELSPKALNQLIAELKTQAVELQKIEQAGEALNGVLRSMKKEGGAE